MYGKSLELQQICFIANDRDLADKNVDLNRFLKIEIHFVCLDSNVKRFHQFIEFNLKNRV